MSGQASGWVLRHGPHPEHVHGNYGREFSQLLPQHRSVYAGQDHATGPYGRAVARRARAVLVTIADAANRDGEHAHPGSASMIEGSLYARSAVMETLGWLEREGWVVVEHRGRGRGDATIYTVVMVPRGKGQSLDLSAWSAYVQERSWWRTDTSDERSTSGSEKVQNPQRALLLPTETSTSTGTGARGPRPVPQDFEITDGMRAWAARTCAGIDVDDQTERFIDYWLGNGRRKHDWVATWRNWMRRASDDAARRGQTGGDAAADGIRYHDLGNDD